MQQQWRIRIRGKKRQQMDSTLLVQAVLALGRQLREEARPAVTDAAAKDGLAEKINTNLPTAAPDPEPGS